MLYEKILDKHLGWFDDRDHGTGILTNIMAQETSLINGACTESIGPQVEAGVAMLLGLGIGFYYCWQESVVCLVLAPILMIGQGLGVLFSKGLALDSAELMKEANLLCADAIVNFKTVQSFGHEQAIYDKYTKLLAPIHTLSIKGNLKAGFAFGLSQLGQYFVFAAMFFAGSRII